MMTRVAGIGSRSLPPEEIAVCEKIGAFLAANGIRVSSGNADGADQAFGRGCNSVDPTVLDLALPWPGFNKEAIVEGNVIRDTHPPENFTLASQHHPKWGRLPDSVKSLMARNVTIIQPELVAVDMVIALPNTTTEWGGGTGFGMKLASTVFHIEVLNIRYWSEEQLAVLCDRILEMKK